MLSDLEKSVARVLSGVTEDSIKRRVLLRTKSSLEESIATANDKLTLALKARQVLSTLVSDRERSTLDKVERLVTHGLRTVFMDSSYEFKILVSQSKNKVNYDFQLSSTGHESADIEEERGGGVINVVSFLLAIVVQLLLDPEARTFIIDEKFAHASTRYVPNIATLLSELSTRMNLQFIQVSHKDPIIEIADTVYTVKKDADSGTAVVVRNT